MYPVSKAFLQAVQENTRRYYWTGRITQSSDIDRYTLEDAKVELFAYLILRYKMYPMADGGLSATVRDVGGGLQATMGRLL